MTLKVDYHLNETQGKEFAIPCFNCTGKTTHKVLVSVDVQGQEEYQNDAFNISWSTDNQIVQCLGCKTVSFRQASSHSEDYEDYNEEHTCYAIREKLYPSRLEGIKGLGDDTHYLPSSIKRIYDETLMALSNQAPVLAGIGLRALLETVCKEKQATGGNLLTKIDNLVNIGILTPASAAILHKIRTLGNDAAHEVKPHSDRQLSLAMAIVEHLLKDVYILPKQVETEFQ
jgi:Domain of unknown function (DUF4145)